MSIYPWLVAQFMPESGFVQGVVAYKTLNLFLLLALPEIIARLVFRKSILRVPLFNILLICAGIFYAATLRQVEIRPEFLAAVCFLVGALVGFDRAARPIGRTVIAVAFLLLSAALTPRLIPVVLPFSVYFIVVFAESELGEMGSRIKAHRYFQFLLPAGLVFVFIMLGLLASVSPIILNQLTAEHHLSILYKFVVSGLGSPLHITLDSPLTMFNIFVFAFRPILLISGGLAGLGLVYHSYRTRLISPTVLGFVPFAWICFLLLDPRPFSYVIILETAVLAAFFWGYVNILGVRPWYKGFAIICICVTFVGSLQSNVSQWRARTAVFASFELPQEDAQLPELLEFMNARNLVVQMVARRIFCENFADYEVAVTNSTLMVCRQNFRNYHPWRAHLPLTGYQKPPPEGYFEDLFLAPKLIFNMPYFDQSLISGLKWTGRYWVKD